MLPIMPMASRTFRLIAQGINEKLSSLVVLLTSGEKLKTSLTFYRNSTYTLQKISDDGVDASISSSVAHHKKLRHSVFRK